MHTLVCSYTPEKAPRYFVSPHGDFDPNFLPAHSVDEHWCAVGADNRESARVSLWWRDTPSHAEHKVGVVGHFAAECEASGALVLEHAVERLREKGCTIVIGPMNGNTWRPYRLVTERGSEPEFLLEPSSPDWWIQCFTEAGFETFAEYFSALNEDLSFEDLQVAAAGKRLQEAGVCLRALDPSCLDDELRRIHQIASVSFCSNLLYTPLTEAEFILSYRRLDTFLRPELIFIAEQASEPIGFVFTIPDWAQNARGQSVDTVIVKTVAVLPERRCAGLGAWLVAQTQLAARRLGYRKAIHALMHESNKSRNLSARYAKTFRRYALFARTL